MGLFSIFRAFHDDFRSIPSHYEFKLKVNVNIRWLHFLKLGYVIVLLVILFLVYLTGGWNYKESGVSSVVTKVRGAGLSDGQVWDAVDYVYPPQEVKAFFITTRTVFTKQVQSECPDNDESSRCKTNADCRRHRRTENGVTTGKCDKLTGMCQIHAWCPVENERSNSTKTTFIHGASNFTVYVRDHEEFIKLNKSRSNDPHSNISSTNCLFNSKTAPLCPIFKISDILKDLKVKFKDLRKMGGVFQFYIKWHCYFNWNSGPCMPRYYFKRIAKDSTGEYSGYSMRYSMYQNVNGVRHRELNTVYGLRFLIMIKSTGEEFRIISFLSNVGSYLSYFAIWTFITGVLCAVLLLDKRDLLTIDESAVEKLVRCRNDGVEMTEGSVIKEYARNDDSKEQNIALISNC